MPIVFTVAVRSKDKWKETERYSVDYAGNPFTVESASLRLLFMLAIYTGCELAGQDRLTIGPDLHRMYVILFDSKKSLYFRIGFHKED